MACRLLFLLYTSLLYSDLSFANSPAHEAGIQVDIVASDGRSFPVYDIRARDRSNIHRAYLQAVDGQNYAIRIINNSGQRLGLVIAVDGRNIISGQKSSLASTERMYILGPWQSATYKGWRTSNRKINRFFFTEAENSYAGAWQDHSAMGVIAVAVFNEQGQYRSYMKKSAPYDSASRDAAAGVAEEAEPGREHREKNGQAGTGFGEENYSYAKIVSFRPVKVALEKYFYKYEWREILCQRGIIECSPHSPNRFWPEHEDYYGYAPYPPN